MSASVHSAIESALRDAAGVLEERGILVVQRLEATVRLEGAGAPLEEALYTVFRALPERLPRGATLYVTTRDRAGGDVELVWEAREAPGAPGASPQELLREGPHGDLLDLALLGLESICRARAGLLERPEPPSGEPASAIAREAGGKVRRRYALLIPGRVHAPRRY